MLHIPAHKANAGQIVNDITLADYIERKSERSVIPTRRTIDTQEVRDAYLARDAEQLDRFFGDFACEFLGVNDAWLRLIANVNDGCRYILKKGYNTVQCGQ